MSVDAFHVSVRPVCVTLEVASPVGIDGGVASGQAVVATMTVAFAERLPAASDASTASV